MKEARPSFPPPFWNSNREFSGNPLRARPHVILVSTDPRQPQRHFRSDAESGSDESPDPGRRFQGNSFNCELDRNVVSRLQSVTGDGAICEQPDEVEGKQGIWGGVPASASAGSRPYSRLGRTGMNVLSPTHGHCRTTLSTTRASEWLIISLPLAEIDLHRTLSTNII